MTYLAQCSQCGTLEKFEEQATAQEAVTLHEESYDSGHQGYVTEE